MFSAREENIAFLSDKGGTCGHMSEYLLEMKNIHKRFPGVYALKGANLNLKSGEVMTLVGENGAGKSTLINILGGIYSKDQGQILINGNDAHITDVLSASAQGISIIHQELVLVPYLTVAENIFINREPGKGIFVNNAEMFDKAQQYINDLGLNIHAETIVSDLNIAEQQMVEIIKAVSFQSRIIVMDEPTSSLSDNEIDALFKNIKKLKKLGIGIIYISHRLSELAQISDRITIFRDGETVGCYKVSDIRNDEIVHLMVGREITNYYTRIFKPHEKIILEISHMTNDKIHDVSFTLHKGEILGISGLVGAGRTEAVEALLGFYPYTSGSIKLSGKEILFKSPLEAYDAEIGYIPEDRRCESLFAMQSVRFNATLRILKQFIHGFVTDTEKEKNLANQYIKKLRIKTPSQEAMIQNLSGGNQQKVIIARWLAQKPKILIMDEPTRGIDVGAKAEIYELMNQLSEEGISIIMVSSDLSEIINMSDRVVVMREGTVSKILSHKEATQDEIMKYAVSI